MFFVNIQAHRDEEDASEQSPSQCRLYDLLQTGIGRPVASEQGCDVKGQLRDGAEGGVHHSADSEVTLGGDTAEMENVTIRFALIKNLFFFPLCRGSRSFYLAMPMPM